MFRKLAPHIKRDQDGFKARPVESIHQVDDNPFRAAGVQVLQ